MKNTGPGDHGSFVYILVFICMFKLALYLHLTYTSQERKREELEKQPVQMDESMV